MASIQSFRLFRYGNLAYHLKFMPYYMVKVDDVFDALVIDPETGERSFRPTTVRGNRRHMILYHIVNGYAMFLETNFILLGFWYYHTRDLSIFVRIQFYLCVVTLLLFIGLQLVSLLFADRMIEINNTVNIFNIRLYEILGLNQLEKDGVEIYLKWMLACIALITICFPIGALAMGANSMGLILDSGLVHHALSINVFCNDNDLGFVKTVNFNGSWVEACPSFSPMARSVLWFIDTRLRFSGKLVAPFAGAFVFLGGLLNIYHYAAGSMIYCAATYRCLKLGRFNPDAEEPASAARKYQLIVAYRALQIVHEVAVHQARHVVLACIVLAAGILTACLVVLVAFNSSLQPLLIMLATVGATMVVMITRVLFSQASALAEASTDFRDSYLRNDRSLRPAERLCLESCQPLQISAGSLFMVNKESYVTFINDVVLDNVISLVIDLKA